MGMAETSSPVNNSHQSGTEEKIPSTGHKIGRYRSRIHERTILKTFVQIASKNPASGLLGLLNDTGAQTFNDHSYADLAPHTEHIQYMVLTTIEWS